MSGTATSPAPGARTRRGVRRPQASQWTPVPAAEPGLEGQQLAPTPAAGPQPAPATAAGPLSFRDLLGPVHAGSTGAATPPPQAAPPSQAAPIAASTPSTAHEPPSGPGFDTDSASATPDPDIEAATPDADATSAVSDERPRRRLAVPRILDRRLALAAATAVALVAGVGSGATAGLLRDGGAEDLAPTTPQQCAAIQAAWTASASSQVGMTADDPATLRDGFLGSRDALDGVPTPSGVAAEWALVTHYVTTVAAAVEPVDPADGEAVTAAVGTAFAALDTAAATAASARVTAYLKAGCVG